MLMIEDDESANCSTYCLTRRNRFLKCKQIMSSMRPVPLDLELEFHERLIHTIGKGISRTKKKLADSELILNVRPSDNEVANLIEWTEKKNKLFEQKEVLMFPTLLKIKKENDERNLLNSLTIGRHQTESNVKWNRRMNKELDKQAQLLRKSILNAHANFGTVTEGTEIKRVDNYKGNTVMIEGSTRTLRTREGKYQPLDVSQSSSLPAWIGPQYYKDSGGKPLICKPDSHYKLPFNQTPRQEELLQGVREQRSRIGQRREQINQYKHQLSSTGSIVTSSERTISSSCSNITHLLEGLDDDDDDIKQMNRAQKGILITDNHLKEAHPTALQAESPVIETNKRSNHFNSLANSWSHEMLPSPVSRADNTSAATSNSPLQEHFIDVSSNRSRRRRRSLQRSKYQQLMTTRAFRDIDAFTAKLLKAADPDFNTRKRTISKSKDYTLNTFAKHPLHSNHIMSSYEPDDKDAPPSSALGLYQNVRPSNTPSGTHASPPRERKVNTDLLGIFTSDIFIVKPPDYIPPKERLHLDLDGNDNKSRPYKRNSFIRDDDNRNIINGRKSNSTTAMKSNSKPSTGRSKSPPTTMLPLEPVIIDDDNNSNVTEAIHDWYVKNDIIRGQKMKRVSARKSFLDKYSVLPSTELSLNGLLLEENPYLPTDPFLRDVVYDI